MTAPAPWFPWNGQGITSETALRNPASYVKVVEQFNVANEKRYAAVAGSTFCNIFAWDVTRAMGVEIPHWIEQSDLEGGAPRKIELDVNLTMNWLVHASQQPGRKWIEVSPDQARSAANAGHPAVATWPNPSGHGHIMVVMPDGSEGPKGQMRIAQAGVQCFSDGPLSRGISPPRWPQLRWWTAP